MVNILKVCYAKIFDSGKILLILIGFVVVVLAGNIFFSESSNINAVLFWLAGMLWLTGTLYYLMLDETPNRLERWTKRIKR